VCALGVIVVDGASNDNSLDIGRALAARDVARRLLHR
jgi:glycosyltransferase involved in cell wall biosynthesis